MFFENRNTYIRRVWLKQTVIYHIDHGDLSGGKKYEIPTVVDENWPRDQ